MVFFIKSIKKSVSFKISIYILQKINSNIYFPYLKYVRFFKIIQNYSTKITVVLLVLDKLLMIFLFHHVKTFTFSQIL